MNPHLVRVAALLFASGFCALVYQVTWLRLLRLIFGGSTAASAAVLAIFMGGLGAGSWILGRRVDRTSRPLALYGRLELGIALAAAASPWLIAAGRWCYLTLGGTARLGIWGGTGARLLLAAIILGLPTFLMGGTLPAVARSVSRESDPGRRDLAVLYGANTLGAVLGAMVTTFLALEMLGIEATIWTASLLNLVVALLALAAGRQEPNLAAAKARRPKAKIAEEETEPSRGWRFPWLAAAVTGFVFLLMELVWYRMLSPILGGSSYTFGLILAVALLGVGLGGLLYGAGARGRRPTWMAFSFTCTLEALLLTLPYAVGDRLAILAMLLRPIGNLSFGLLTLSWFAITAFVVLPAAIVAGYQFPLLVGLIGKGRRGVGRDVGRAYAWNTAGAILGSIAGGFGLLPLLSAPGAWALSAWVLLALGAAAAVLDLRRSEHRDGRSAGRRLLLPAAVVLLTIVLLGFPGPQAAWRHTPIGAGGMPASFEGPNGIEKMSRAIRRALVWERDGVESSVAIHGLDDYSFLINGKSDGSALRDAPTQVMSGLVGSMLHRMPRQALVIGLGSGSSAGWLAEVPSIEGVDVVELEAIIERVAELCAPVNFDVLNHPKADLIIGDGREYLLTSDKTYDVIFSEPSNPYRAGIASLFTREFYRAVADRLGRDGIFLQWLQAYHLDSQVVRTLVSTLRSVFPAIEIWQVHSGDLLLVASRSPIEHDSERVRRRAAQEPYRSALAKVYGVQGVEGFYAGFLAGPELATAMAQQEGERLNTDDHPIVEFGFARSVGRDLEFSVSRIASLAALRREAQPQMSHGILDWRRVLDQRSARNAWWGEITRYPPTGDRDLDSRVVARNAYVEGDLGGALRAWESQTSEPTSPLDRLLLAEALADQGDERAEAMAGLLESDGQLLAAQIVRAILRFEQGQLAAASRYLQAAFLAAREDPWVHRLTLERAILLAIDLSGHSAEEGKALFEALDQPFAVHLLDELRRRARVEMAAWIDFAALCVEAFTAFEPHVPWEESFLRSRLRCYDSTGHGLAERARRELATFVEATPSRLEPERIEACRRRAESALPMC